VASAAQLDAASSSSSPTSTPASASTSTSASTAETTNAVPECAGLSARLNATVHPLLSPDLLAIKQSIDTFVPKEKDVDEDEALLTAFGTLSISDGQTMRFLGASATEQLLLMEVFEKSSTPSLHTSALSFSPALEQISTLWPFAPLHLPASVLSGQLVAQLPPIERVTALYEAYFTNLAWFLAPVDRAHVVDELIPLFYPRPARRAVDPAAM
ncbi:hypothetical protein EW145_g8678, partial [Phellinidium pouzarii]